MTVSVTGECGPDNVLYLFSEIDGVDLAGMEFTATICVNGEFYEEVILEVPSQSRHDIAGWAGYDCPSTWRIKFNYPAPEECTPWVKAHQ